MKPPPRVVHLICNAHLDPVWLWEWEEGAAAAVSTFRTAADLCERHRAFVFNHNEAVLYEWVERYEPALFRRIQRLVRRGRWHIMGGWFLQPDCNLPSGESVLRQIGYGRRYFADRFKVRPTTAINFDPFGHTRGLVQILARCGFDAYLFCRPGPNDSGISLPGHEFRWVGFDGSEVIASRAVDHYLSHLGKARAKVETHLRVHPDRDPDYVLWGVGDHGGGPSALDLGQLEELRRETSDAELRHSTPEAFFRDLRERATELPIHEGDINPWAVGCYTSQVRIKQRHRALENALILTEKMCTIAAANDLLTYPHVELREAERDLLFAQFHDILPGSAIASVEEQSLRLMDHGLEILSRERAHAFFALAAGQPPARPGEIPVLVFNPHPHRVRTTIECEFQLEDQNLDKTWTVFDIRQGRKTVSAQTEQEASNLNLDWRKRVVFAADLEPGVMNRFDCRLRKVPAKPSPAQTGHGRLLVFSNDSAEVVINRKTGCLERYRVHGTDILGRDALRPTVFLDDPNPWKFPSLRIDRRAGAFRLLNAREAGRFAGLEKPLAPVRIIEDGPVRSVVEALFGYETSRLCLRYLIPTRGSEIGIEARVFWNEKDRMLKLAVPCLTAPERFLGQTAFGVHELALDGREAAAQKWVAACWGNTAVTAINDGTYGFSCARGTLWLNLLRSPAYAAHPIGDRPLLPTDRFTPRIDQGERLFRFWLNAGPADARLAVVDREALVHNEAPPSLSFFPSGAGERPQPVVVVSARSVTVSALIRLESGGTLFRVFEPTGRTRTFTVRVPLSGLSHRVELRPWQFRTFVLSADLGSIRATDPFGAMPEIVPETPP